jgi:hypothetical protein
VNSNTYVPPFSCLIPVFWPDVREPLDGETGGTLVFTYGLLDNKTPGFQACKGAIHASTSCGSLAPVDGMCT